MPKHILSVDDEPLMLRSLRFSLEQNGYRVSDARKAEDALAITRRDRPDLILLDIGLPVMDGLDALREFRAACDAPVVFVSARRREFDQVIGLEMGADDYITKPFDMSVLLARVKAALRHGARETRDAESPIVTVGDLQLDPLAHEVRLDEIAVPLSPREFDLLHALMLEAGHVVSTDDLLARVWGAEFAGEPQVVYVHMRWLREKIEQDPNNPGRIVTVRGVGYKLLPFPR